MLDDLERYSLRDFIDLDLDLRLWPRSEERDRDFLPLDLLLLFDFLFRYSRSRALLDRFFFNELRLESELVDSELLDSESAEPDGVLVFAISGGNICCCGLCPPLDKVSDASL